jgi:hypothetical protein
MAKYRVTFGVLSNNDIANITLKRFKELSNGESPDDFEEQQAFTVLSSAPSIPECDSLVSIIADNYNGSAEEAEHRLEMMAKDVGWEPSVREETHSRSGDPYMIVSGGGSQGLNQEAREDTLSSMGFSV